MFFNQLFSLSCKEASRVALLGIIGCISVGCKSQTPPAGRQLDSHTNPVQCVVFSPDGQTLVTGGWNSFSSEKAELLVWDAKTHRLKTELKGHQKPIKGVAFNPKRNILASTSWDGTIRIWDIPKCKEVGKLEWDRDQFVMGGCLAWSPDGKTLAAGGTDESIRFWDVVSQKEVGKVDEAHRLSVDWISFTPDGKYFATCSHDKEAKVWDADSRKLHLAIRDLDSDVWSVAFTHDNKTVIVGCDEGKVILQGLHAERKRRSITTGLPFLACLAVSPDGKVLAVGGGDDERRGVIEFYEMDSLKRVGIIKAKELPILGLAFSPDGRTIAGCSYSEENSITVFEVPEKPKEKKKEKEEGKSNKEREEKGKEKEKKKKVSGTLEDWP